MNEKSISLLNEEGNVTEIYFLRSKSTLSDDFFQKLLKDNHGLSHRIKCNCKDDKTLFLSIKEYKKKSGEFYTLARYPKQEHNDDCIFNSEIRDLINDEDELEYKCKIFEEVETSKSEPNDSYIESNAIRYTYYHFCIEVIAKSCKYAFNKANYNKEYLHNFTFQDFISSFISELKKQKISKYENIFNFTKSQEGVYFEYGIIDEDIFKDDDCVSINVRPIKFNNDTRRYYIADTSNRDISKKRYNITKNLVKIFNNTIAPPYFYMAVKNYNEIVRLYIYPIFLTDEYVTFIESNLERKFAEKLINQNYIFIKPIDNNELNVIKPTKIIEDGKVPYLQYRPDFIVFKEFSIHIVEVAGFTEDKEYMKHLGIKEEYYNSLNKYYKNINKINFTIYSYKCRNKYRRF